MIPFSAGWRLQRRVHLFAERCTAHIPKDRAHNEVLSEILRKIRQARESDLTLDLDPRFRLRVESEDLDGGRLDRILRSFNGLPYLDDVRFQEGLERTS